MASESDKKLSPEDDLKDIAFPTEPILPTKSPAPTAVACAGITAPSSSVDLPKSPPITLLLMPGEVQIYVLTFLRAYDLSAVQRTCRFFNAPTLIHEIVTHQADFVYTREYVDGFETVVVDGRLGNKGNSSSRGSRGNKNSSGRSRTRLSGNKHQKKVSDNGTVDTTTAAGDGDTMSCQKVHLYTLEHLRNMELRVVAKILSTPEPKTGFYVSKSWIKKALLWLEKVNEPQQQQQQLKKLSKKQLRQRARRLSDVNPPWPDVNSDIMCTHQNLQRCGVKSARSRRRLMDKQAWKILKKLYPDSTQLDSVKGECLQCLVENETARRNERAEMEQKKLERKKPLTNPNVRRFYTRTRGVPMHCLVKKNTCEVLEKLTDQCEHVEQACGSATTAFCPLIPGTYHILPRVWCHQWRRYIKTGEGCVPQPPDATALLCHAHRLALLPPHLEAYLNGETKHLLSTTKQICCDSQAPPATAIPPPPNTPVGLRPRMDPNAVHALMMAGLSPAELASQQMAMLQLQHRLQPQPPHPLAPPSSNSSTPTSRSDLLDRENHVVVEIVTDDEWLALQEMGCCGPRQLSNFTVSFVVSAETRQFTYSTIPCRDCDASGKASSSSMSIKNRSRGKWASAHHEHQHSKNNHNSKRNGIGSAGGDSSHKHRSPSLEY